MLMHYYFYFFFVSCLINNSSARFLTDSFPQNDRFCGQNLADILKEKRTG